MKFNAKVWHQRGWLDNYNQHLDETIDVLSKEYLGKFGIVGIADGIWNAGPVPGRPQGGPYFTCIFIYTTHQPDVVKKLIPKQFNGYSIIVQKTGPFIPRGIYGKKLQ